MQTGTLTISRPCQYADMLRRYRIWVDGKGVADVRRGDEVRLDLSPGEHEVVASLDGKESNRLSLAVGAGDQIELEVGNALSGWRALAVIYYVTFARKRYLYLRHRVMAFPVSAHGCELTHQCSGPEPVV